MRRIAADKIAIDGGTPLRTEPFGPRWIDGDEMITTSVSEIGTLPGILRQNVIPIFGDRRRSSCSGSSAPKWGSSKARTRRGRRVEEAARYVPLSQLAISPQCGFASDAEGNPMTWDEQAAKLELLVRVARQIWANDSC
jgi:hypothetical protein